MFQTLFYEPVLNLLIFIYNFVPNHDLGISIILLTIVIKAALWPISKKALESQQDLQELQPEMERIKKEHKDNKEELGRATMKLYKEKKINPFSSCLPLLIQLPFFIAVFHVFRDGFENGSLELVYSFIARPDSINSVALWGVDLSQKVPIFAILAGAAQFAQAKMTMAKTKPSSDPSDMQSTINKQMLYLMPIVTVVIGLTLPGGLSLYWLTTTLLTIFQQSAISKKPKKKKDDDDKAPTNTHSKEQSLNKGDVLEGEVVK